MDRTKDQRRRKDWSWLPDFMPGVSRQIADKRKAFGADWVNECWKRSMAGEPGWLFAREGSLAVGTPFDDPELANFAALQVTSTQALLVMRKPPEETADA